MKKRILLFLLLAVHVAGYSQTADTAKTDAPKQMAQKLYYFQFNEDYTNAILKIIQNSDESHKVVNLVLNAFVYQLQHQPLPDTTHKAAAVVPSKTKKK